jgi:hypothetical protein
VAKPTPVRDQRGQILIVTVLSMTVLLGVAALSIDASFMYDRRNLLFAAADAAAKSVATELHRNSSLTVADARNFAEEQVSAHGLVPGACNSPTTGVAGICLYLPPSTGPFTDVAGYVEVTVSEVTPTFFGYVLGFASATPGGRAVAGISPSPNCVVTLGSAIDALTIATGALTLHGCSIADGGGLAPLGAAITADSVSVASLDCAGVANCHPNSPPPTDPFAGLQPPAPVIPPGCVAPFDIIADTTINEVDLVKYYCGMTIGTAVVTFTPGVYQIAGPVTAKTAASNITLTGSDVMFFIAPGGLLDLSGSNVVTMNLSAPTSGLYRGILFYQQRGETAAARFLNTIGTLNLSGALYFPDAALAMKNDNGLSIDCSLIVAKTLTIRNNTDLNRSCAAYGVSPVQTISIAE